MPWHVTVLLAIAAAAVVFGGRWRTSESMGVSATAAAVTAVLILAVRLAVEVHSRRR